MGEVYYDRNGKPHRLYYRWSYGRYEVIYDKKHYAFADDRAEANEIIADIKIADQLTDTPQTRRKTKVQKKTSLQCLTAKSEI